MTRARIYIAIAVAAVMLAGAVPAAAQHYVGIRGGYDGGSGRFYPKPSESGTVWGLYHGGLSWKYYTEERYVGGVEVDLLFMQQGYRNYTLSSVAPGNEEAAERISHYQRTVNSVMLPIYWQTHVFMFKRHLRIFLNLGVTFSYNFSSTEERHNYLTGETTSGKYDMKLTRDNPLGYGLGGGFGFGWNMKRLEIFAEGRYYFGYGDILRNYNKYEQNPLRSPLDNIQISAGVYWKLGKKKEADSDAQASLKAQARAQDKLERRSEKELFKSLDAKMEEWDAEEQEALEAEKEAAHEAVSQQVSRIRREMARFMGNMAVRKVPPVQLGDIPSYEPAA